MILTPTGLARSQANLTVEMAGKNIGDLPNEKGVTWGWFAGDWSAGSRSQSADCRSHQSIDQRR